MLQIIREVAIYVKGRIVDIVIPLHECIQYWKGCREKTSSSVFNFHFGHWKAAASSNKVAEIHKMKTQVAFQSGNPTTWWCKGLQLVLKNIAGKIKMEK